MTNENLIRVLMEDLKWQEKRINKSEDKSIEIIQSEQQKKKKMNRA